MDKIEVQKIIDEYIEVSKSAFTFVNKQRSLLDLLNSLAENKEKRLGAVKLDGTTKRVKLDRRVNISHSDEQKLKDFLHKYPEVVTKLFKQKISWSEKKAKVLKVLKEGQAEWVKELDSLLIIKDGKPGIEIEDIKQ